MTAFAQPKLPSQTAAKLAGHAERIRAALQRSLVEVGRELTEAKALTTHGQFTKWVERECGMTARTAQLIMSAYRLCLNEKFSLLGRSALFILGAADVPAAAIAAIEKLVAAGDVPRYTDVHAIVRAASRDRPSPVTLAVKMEREPTKATVVDLDVHRILSKVKATLAEAAPERRERQEYLEEFRDRIDVADIAIMLNAILDSGQVFRLTTMIRKTAPGATLAELAAALEAI